MAQLLTLEWDSYEARVAVARSRGEDVIIEQAFSVALLPRDAGQTVADVNVGERIAAALAARHLGRMDTLVAVGRASIELRLLTVPPATDDELPALVRFQAMQHFAAFGDDWTLDFVPIDAGTDAGRNVLAAAISAKLVQQIEQTCLAAGLTPRRLIMRPFAAASLLRRHDPDSEHRVRLMVDLLTDEADLTVMVDRTVVFIRTVRLPGHADSPDSSSVLLGEIRRTMAAAQNQLGGQRVQLVVLSGTGEEHAALKSLVEEDLSLPVQLFDPFAGLRLSRELRSHPPDAPGRFAPLLGLLIDEAAGNDHAIDFLHPRRKPEPPSRRRTFILAGAAVAAVLLFVAGLVSLQFARLHWKQTSLTGQFESLEKKSEAADEQISRAAEIDQWTRSDVTWLDELRELSLEFPPADDAIVTQMQIGSRSKGGGNIAMEGFVRSSEVIDKMERVLRDEQHGIVGTDFEEDSSLEGYNWRFLETLTVRAQAESPRRRSKQSQQDASTARSAAKGSTAHHAKAEGR